MKLKIYKYGEPVLREKSEPVAVVTEPLRILAADMIATMHAAKGVGLAAQQVGRTERICVIDIPEGCENEEDEAFNSIVPMPLVLFNPEIISRDGTQLDKEGCLSFPGIGGSVERAAQVTCQYLDMNNMPQIVTARGFLARAIQHELDHLDGVLYVDHLSEAERLSFEPKLKKLSDSNGGVR